MTSEMDGIWTYPYEWCFSRLKEAALLTLSIQLEPYALDSCSKKASIFKQTQIEFVPKEDPVAHKMLANRDNIFYDYSELAFEEHVTKRYKLQDKILIPDSSRSLYLLRRNN